MRRPRPANTAIDANRYRRWTDEFGGYRHSVTQTTIQSWLEQFDAADRDLAARVLDAVEYFKPERIGAAFRSALQSLTGWSANPANRTGRWFFVPFAGSAGTSGDAMLYQFRLANNLDNRGSDGMFIYRSELVAQKLTAIDTVVFLDDLTATGQQVCTVWDEHFAELVVGAGRVYLVVVVAGKGARKEIKEKTELRLVPGHQLDLKDTLFGDDCACFTDAEKDRLLHYAKIADVKKPMGFGDCGYLLVFQHRCPNNSVPILHENHSKWLGLFLRHD